MVVKNCRQKLLSKIVVKNCCQKLLLRNVIKNCQNCKKIVKMLVSSCFLITVIKCLKGHRSLGSLCSVVKQGTMSPIKLLWT